MRTINLNVFKFDELNEQAQARAISAYAETSATDYNFSEPKESLEQFANHFDLVIRDWEYGSGVCWVKYDRRLDDDILNLSGVRLLKWLINNHAALFSQTKVITENRETIRYGFKQYDRVVRRVSGCVKEATCCPFTGVCFDESLLAPMREFIARPDYAVTLEGLIERCIDSWCSDIKADIDYQDSEEYIKESMLINQENAEYYENGDLFKGVE